MDVLLACAELDVIRRDLPDELAWFRDCDVRQTIAIPGIGKHVSVDFWAPIMAAHLEAEGRLDSCDDEVDLLLTLVECLRETDCTDVSNCPHLARRAREIVIEKEILRAALRSFRAERQNRYNARMGTMYDLLRGLPIGEAVLIPSRWEPNARQETFWAVRIKSSEIEWLKARIRDDGILPVRQRATLNRCVGVDGKTEVLVAAVLLGLGPDPVDPASVYVGLIDEHHPIFGHRLETLTTQDTVGIVFIGDSERVEYSAEAGNVVRPFAQKALAMISEAPPWSPADFKHAGIAWKQRYPNRAVLWNEIGEGSPGGLKRLT